MFHCIHALFIAIQRRKRIRWSRLPQTFEIYTLKLFFDRINLKNPFSIFFSSTFYDFSVLVYYLTNTPKPLEASNVIDIPLSPGLPFMCFYDVS